MTLSCPEVKSWQALLQGTLPETQQTELNAHLETCPACQQTLEGLVASQESWSGTAKDLHQAPLDPTGKLGEVMARLKANSTAGGTHAEGDSGGEVDLTFLQPPRQPGHLGRLKHYEILEVLGKGGFGTVFKAQDEALARVVAVKVLAPQLATNATARKRFLREAKAAAAVSHDHVVGIFAVEESDGIPYIAMQLVVGKTLQERLDQAGPLELKEILRIGMQVADGLAAAHKQGLVHRDIKPANILLENGVERVKITDFGLARAIDDASLTQSGVIAGTPMFMAPEQAAGEAVDHRADLFSLGSVLYAMCTGRPPFRAVGTLAVLKRVCEDTPAPIRETHPEIPPWLCDIIANLMAKRPADRFQTAREVTDLLSRHLAHEQQPGKVPMPAPVASPAAPTARPARPRRWRHRVAGLALVAVLAWLLLWFGPAALRYLGNRGELAFSTDSPGLERIEVLRDGRKFTDFDPQVNPTIELPPGKYRLKPTQTPGRAVNYWQLTSWGMFDGEQVVQPGISCEFELGRGRRLRIRALMHDSWPGPSAGATAGLSVDEKLLQGIWIPVSAVMSGKPLPEEDFKTGRLVFAGRNVTISMKGMSGRTSYVLDSTRVPKTISFAKSPPAVNPNLTEEEKLKKVLDIINGTTTELNVNILNSIYTVDEETLTLCCGPAEGPFPTKLESPADSPFNLYVFKREGKDQPSPTGSD